MIIYAFRSELKSIMSYTDMQDICLSSARNNRKWNVTGYMVECGGVFLQALEGPEDAVTSIFRRVVNDPRHHHVDLLLSNDGVARRQFGAWAMNLMFLDDPLLWRRVIGSLSPYDDFLHRSQDPIFALGLLSLAYQFACSATSVDAAATGLKRGRVPRIQHMLRS
ncbi:BLUF domain-containing protein (plasmid) [Azospirillum sp. A29]|uniref:BLUF domain-containing protein n=1 Tax=Azospirillum sp. A29 TaxID=3160606 RepID=UPI0036700934